jgi:MFS family permease
VQVGTIKVQQLPMLSMLSVSYTLLIGLSSTFKIFWLQYAGAVLASVGLGCALQIEKVVAVQWWAASGQGKRGKAIMGFGAGCWVCIFTLISALLLNSLGLAGAMYVLTGIIFMCGLPPLWLQCVGKFQAPPPQHQKQLTINDCSTSLLTPAKVLRTLTFWQMFFNCVAITFTGLGMKALLSPIFVAAYNVSYLESAYLAAASVALFAAMRGLAPLLSGHISFLTLSTCLFLLDTVMFAINPTVVLRLPVGWLVLTKTITGAVFSALLVINVMVVLETFGPENFGRVYPLFSPGAALGYTVGPLVGYYTSLAGIETGRAVYNPFFYVCAAISGVACLNNLLLQRRLAWQQNQLHEPAKEQSALPA